MYQTRTFFEYIGSADIELIHSQMIAWLLSDNFQGFTYGEQTRNKLFMRFFNLSDTKIKCIATEQNAIDILIELSDTVLCVENKIKSSQHANQLRNYEEKLNNNSRYKEKKKKFFFLTLVEEKADKSNWTNISYNELLHVLKDLEQEGEINDSFNGQLLKEYMKTIDKMLKSIQRFMDDPSSCPNVFQEAGLRKEIKADIILDCDLQRYIRANQFETLFQKLYMREVMKSIEQKVGKKNHSYLAETRGNAYLGFFLFTNIKVLEGEDFNKFNFGIDFQNGTFKTFCISTKYEESTKDHMPKNVINTFNEIKSKTDNYGYRRTNGPKSKAQCSITKPIDISTIASPTIKHWWQLTPEQLANLYIEQIDISRKLIADYIFEPLNLIVHE